MFAGWPAGVIVVNSPISGLFFLVFWFSGAPVGG
jgi:hypothetical protein